MNTVSVVCVLIIILIILIARVIHKSSEPNKNLSENIVTELPNIKKYQKRIEKYIEVDLSKATQGRPGLNLMCSYAVSGGKKIRSIILLSILEKNAISQKSHSDPAIAVEYLHAASLILDDIADKDDYRRGRKSMHKLFGVGKAQMCALYLIGHAGKLLQKSAKSLNNNELVIFIYDNLFANLRKLIEGQYVDISNEGGAENTDSDIIHKKTGTMFEIPFVLGWTFSKLQVPSQSELFDLKTTAHMFGQIFQIADDFDDMEKDAKSHAKFNYVLNHGIKEASTYFVECITKFNTFSSKMNICTDEIKEVVTYLYKKVESFTVT